MSDPYAFGNVLRQAPPEPEAMPEPVEVEIVGDPDVVSTDPKTGVLTIHHSDGSVTVDTNPQKDECACDKEHFENIADDIDPIELNRIADELLRGIEIDDQSRRDWLDTRARGIELLGLELKAPGTSAGGQLEGTSKVVHPILLESVLRFQANARGELLPSDGPVKIKIDGESTKVSTELAQALEDDLNDYLTRVASEYYPDSDRMLLFTGFGGCGFKKVYTCPIRRRPVSESVDAKDLIVSNAATDLKSCGRVTQAITMRPSTLKRMQLLGVYRDIELGEVTPKTTNPVDQKIAQVQGVQPPTQVEPKIIDRDLYECYCELDIQGFEHKEKKEVTGLPLPYKVTIDRDSRQVLEVCRNWDADDEMCLAKTVFVKYPFVPGFGFYDIGLLNILGNTTLAATAAWRELLDAGMFSNFPGFLYLKALAKQLTNEFRIPPGGGLPIDAAGDDIRAAVMPLPYKPPDAATMQLVQNIVETGQRVGGTAELQVGEGRQDAPVGTTLALIEQATKVLDAVHKRLHQAQAQEFQLLKQRFIEDPEALWRHNKKSAGLKMMLVEHGGGAYAQLQEQAQEAMKTKFIAALNDCELVPQADPNTASQMSRIMKAVALIQLATANPQLYDVKEVHTRALKSIGWSDTDALFAPPQPPGAQPDPHMLSAQAAMAGAHAKLTDSQTKARTANIDAEIKKLQLASQERVAELQVQREAIIHARDTQLETSRLHADNLNQHLDRQADMQKHHATLRADQMGTLREQGQQHMDRAAEAQQAEADRALDHHHRTLDRDTESHHRHVDRLAEFVARQQQSKERKNAPPS